MLILSLSMTADLIGDHTVMTLKLFNTVLGIIMTGIIYKVTSLGQFRHIFPEQKFSPVFNKPAFAIPSKVLGLQDAQI